MPTIYKLNNKVLVDGPGSTKVAIDPNCCCCTKLDSGSLGSGITGFSGCTAICGTFFAGPWDQDVIFVVLRYTVDDDVSVNGQILDQGCCPFTDQGGPCSSNDGQNGAHQSIQSSYCFFIPEGGIVEVDAINNFSGACGVTLPYEVWTTDCCSDPNWAYHRGSGCC